MQSLQQDAISKCGHFDCHGIGMCNAGKGKKSMELFEQMQQEGVQPISGIFVGITLVDMYAKCGSIEDAWRLFDNMPY